jgi:hypothetical protein
MAATTYGSTNAQITLSSATSGSGDSIAPATIITYVLAKKARMSIGFNSKVSNNATHKSRLTPDGKYVQGFTVNDAVLVGAADVNGTTEWLTEAYIAKNAIYAIVKIPPATGSTYIWKSWYNDSNSKVYYLKGVLGKLNIDLTQGRLIPISFDFKEAWN